MNNAYGLLEVQEANLRILKEIDRIPELSKGKLVANVKHYLSELSKQWEELPPYFITSSETRQGRDEVLDYIEKILKN